MFFIVIELYIFFYLFDVVHDLTKRSLRLSKFEIFKEMTVPNITVMLP